MDDKQVAVPRYRPNRKRGAWRKDYYTFKQHRALIKILRDTDLIPESEKIQILYEIHNNIMTKGRAADYLDKYLPLFRELKQQEADNCRITDPAEIQKIQDDLLRKSANRKEANRRRRERGSCIKE